MKTNSMNLDELKSNFAILNDQQLKNIIGGQDNNTQGEDDDDDIWMNE